MRRVLVASFTLLIAFGIGVLWGAWGRSAAERGLKDLQLRSDLLDARGAVLDARLDIYSVNFGNASQHLETAKTLLTHAKLQLTTDNDTKQIDQALILIAEAQGLSGRLDQTANATAARAAGIINDVLKTRTVR
ncbi:MAG TPA: hypothetical protein VNZ26_30445 [Vicinamibacterales bacterium]|nr:hypothetical protein [Vicinamibacterales bacterium]